MAESKSLSLKEFLSLSDHKERILIVSDVSKGNTLIRMFEKKEGKMVHNISCETIGWIADQIYIYDQAGKGFEQEFELIDDQAALMIFREVLFENIESLKYYYDKSTMLSIATTKEIFDKANLMRGNECSIPDSNERLSDLKCLIGLYEDKLIELNKHDRISRIDYALNAVRHDPSCIRSVGVDTEMFYLKEETELYNSKQNKLLSLISGSEVCVFEGELESDDVLDTLASKKDNVVFYKGFGSINEANYIAYDILANKYNFGDALVLYNSDDQIPAICAALRGNGIPMNVVSNYPAADNNVISLARSIVSWAKDCFSEESFEKILGNPVLYVYDDKPKENPETAISNDDTSNIDTDPDNVDINPDSESAADLSEEDKAKLKGKNLVAGEKYFKYVLDGRLRMDETKYVLGWGYARNLEYADNEKQYSTAQKNAGAEDWKYTSLKIMEMHENLLDIFNCDDEGKTSLAELFEKLCEFLRKYTRPVFIKEDADASGKEKWKKADNSHEVGIGLIKRLSEAVSFDKRNMLLEEILDAVEEMLCSLEVSDTSDSGSVTVHKLNDWIPLDRKQIHIIGLSLTEMQVSSNQSPVIHDDELDDLLKSSNSFIPTVDNRIRRKEMITYRTLASFDEGGLTFGYSFRDTVNNTDKNPSSFYSVAHDHIKGHGDTIVSFEYGNPTEHKTVSKENADEKAESIITVFEGQKLSSSALETFLNCPKSFAYSRVQKLPDNVYCERDASKWLDPRTTGTFFHEILKEYSLSEMRKATSDLTEDEIQQIRTIAEKVKDESIIKEVPIPYKEYDVNKDIENLLKRMVIPYINDLRKDMKENDWKIWKPETKFGSFEFKVNTFDRQEVNITIKEGFIDCIDYQLDEENKTVNLRIRDYKTGKIDKKKKEKGRGLLIQYLIYRKGLMDTDLLDTAKKEISAIEGGKTDGWNYVLQYFRYDFPKERGNQTSIVIPSELMARLNIIRLSSILTVMKTANTYPDPLELKNILLNNDFGIDENCKENCKPYKNYIEMLSDKLDNQDGKYRASCTYCAYKDICINRKAGLIKDEQ